MTSGSRHSAPEQGSWNVPGAPPAYPPAGESQTVVRRGRPVLTALIVALVELAAVAAIGNQAVSKHTQRYGLDHLRSFAGYASLSFTQYTWRVTPQRFDNRGGYHVYYSQLTAIAVLVVVSVLLTLVLARGDVTFWRVLIGVTTAVVFATFLGRVLGALVSKPVVPGLSRGTGAVFQSTGSGTFFYGVLLGLLAGLIAAIVAVAARRTVTGPPPAPIAPGQPPYVPEAPPPFYGTPAPDVRPRDPRAENETTALPSLSKGSHSTQQLPEAPVAPDEQDGRTTQIPRFDPRGGQQWTPPQDTGQATQAMPNAPEDDGRR